MRYGLCCTGITAHRTRHKIAVTRFQRRMKQQSQVHRTCIPSFTEILLCAARCSLALNNLEVGERRLHLASFREAIHKAEEGGKLEGAGLPRGDIIRGRVCAINCLSAPDLPVRRRRRLYLASSARFLVSPLLALLPWAEIIIIVHLLQNLPLPSFTCCCSEAALFAFELLSARCSLRFLSDSLMVW